MGFIDQHVDVFAFVHICRHLTEFMNHTHNNAPEIIFQKPLQLPDAFSLLHVVHSNRFQVLQHLIFQLVAINHQQNGGLLTFGSFEQQFSYFNHRIGLATPLCVPDQPSCFAGIMGPFHHLLNSRFLMLAQDILVQLLVGFRKQNELFKVTKNGLFIAKRFDLGFQVADLFFPAIAGEAFPVENIASDGVPGNAV